MTDRKRVVSCNVAFDVTEPAEFEFQIAAAVSADSVLVESLDIRLEGEATIEAEEIRGPHHARLHVVRSPRGRLTVAYRAEIEAAIPDLPAEDLHGTDGWTEVHASLEFSEFLYLRPSRYCPTDHLVGFALSEFGTGSDTRARVEAIVEWIRHRIAYVSGSGTVHDSAEDTLLTGAGTCRDFAHLGVSFCRSIGVPARFTAVYAPGLSPMDFHAVFETLQDGRWFVHDATDLAPRSAMVRIVTGRDAADAAFASVGPGVASLEQLQVTATVGSDLPADDRACLVELA